MNALTVDVPPDLTADLVPVLASLPDDFRVTADGERGEVLVVDGRLPDWPALIERSLQTVRGVMLRDPGVPEVPAGGDAVEVLRDLATRSAGASVPVVVDRRWGGAPGVASFAREFGTPTASATSVTVLVVEADLSRSGEDAAVDALGLARAAGAAAGRLARFHRRRGSWSAQGATVRGAPLHLMGVLSTAGGGATFTASTASWQTAVSVPHPHSAAPAVARRTDEAGERLLPTEFEGAPRAAWRRLRELLRDGTDRATDLSDLAEDLALLRGAV